MQRRDIGLHAYRRLVGIYAHRQVVQCHLDHIVSDLLRIAPVVRQCLIVGDQHIDLVELARVLQLHPPFKRPRVVSQMQSSRRTIPCQYDLLISILCQHNASEICE